MNFYFDNMFSDKDILIIKILDQSNISSFLWYLKIIYLIDDINSQLLRDSPYICNNDKPSSSFGLGFLCFVIDKYVSGKYICVGRSSFLYLSIFDTELSASLGLFISLVMHRLQPHADMALAAIFKISASSLAKPWAKFTNLTKFLIKSLFTCAAINNSSSLLDHWLSEYFT